MVDSHIDHNFVYISTFVSHPLASVIFYSLLVVTSGCVMWIPWTTLSSGCVRWIMNMYWGTME